MNTHNNFHHDHETRRALPFLPPEDTLVYDFHAVVSLPKSLPLLLSEASTDLDDRVLRALVNFGMATLNEIQDIHC